MIEVSIILLLSESKTLGPVPSFLLQRLLKVHRHLRPAEPRVSKFAVSTIKSLFSYGESNQKTASWAIQKWRGCNLLWDFWVGTVGAVGAAMVQWVTTEEIDAEDFNIFQSIPHQSGRN